MPDFTALFLMYTANHSGPRDIPESAWKRTRTCLRRGLWEGHKLTRHVTVLLEVDKSNNCGIQQKCEKDWEVPQNHVRLPFNEMVKTVRRDKGNYRTTALISHASKAMLKILQARLQQYMNRELPDVQAGFRKGRGTRDQIANISWIMEKAREFQKTIYFCFIDYAKAFDCVDHNKLKNSERDGNTRPPDLSLETPVCRSGSNS